MLAAILLLVINFMILMKMDDKKKKGGSMCGGRAGAPVAVMAGTERAGTMGDADWTVYGTMGCGWTRKQLDYMKKKGVTHTFVDCDKEGCPGMDAFPTMVHKSGEKIVGYKEV